MTAKETNAPALDLGDIQKNTHDREWMEVHHPTTGKPTGIRIQLYSAESEHYRDAHNKAVNRRLRQRRSTQQLTVEESEQEALTILAKATADWENMQLNGEKLSCTQDNARRVYADFPWLREQVEAFINERENFIKS